MPKSKNKKSSGRDADDVEKAGDNAKDSVKAASQTKDTGDLTPSSAIEASSADKGSGDDGAAAKKDSEPAKQSSPESEAAAVDDIKGVAKVEEGDVSDAKDTAKASASAKSGMSHDEPKQEPPSKAVTSYEKKEGEGATATAADDSKESNHNAGDQQKQRPSPSNQLDKAISRAPNAPTTSPTTDTKTSSPSQKQQHHDPPPPKNAVDFDDDYSDSKDTLLTMTFNQDGGCLAVGTGAGFRICNVNPFQETFRRSLGGGGVEGGAGIARIEMLYRTNLLALTGHSTSPQYPPNKVLIYDDHRQRTIGELSFRQKVLTIKLRRDRIVVVLRDRVYIYNFSDLALLDKIHTGDNPLGLIGISTDNGGVGGSTTSVERAEDALGGSGTQRNNGMVLACPSKQRGQVRVELYGLRRTTFVDAHESQLGALALSVDGSLLATASERGTVIRLFDTRGVTIGGGTDGNAGAKKETTSVSSSVPLREFRRGVERATISCLTFSLDSNWLGCASNHGTVHVFQTQDPNANSNAESAKKSRSITGRAMRMLPKLVSAPKKYLMDGVQSYAQVRGVPHPRACAFVPDKEQTIAVAGVDEYGNGCLLIAEFGKPSNSGGDSRSGSISESKMVDDSEARRLGYHRFFKCKSPASQAGRRRTKSKDNKLEDTVEGGAYIDDAPVDMKMNHISIGDENEDNFVPIDYNEE